MQYIVALSSNVDVGREKWAALIDAEDASAIIDFPAGSGVMRISTSLRSQDLRALATAAGFHLGPDAIEQLPSECCGGCGG